MTGRPLFVRHGRRPLVDPRSDGFAAFLLALLLGPERHAQFGLGLVVSVMLVVSRDVALRRRVGPWIIPLDGFATFLVTAWTSAPLSEFHFVCLAGIWWAGRLVPRRGAALFAVSFLVPYAIVVLPDAWARGYLAEATDDVLTVALIALLVDWFMAVERRAISLSAAIGQAQGRVESPIELRRRLAMAAGETTLPVDSLIVGGQLGLTADEIELLGYLMLGFGNARIAQAIGRSEATVRYRLTRLYRTLGVTGRAAAIARAKDLGLGSTTAERTPS